RPLGSPPPSDGTSLRTTAATSSNHPRWCVAARRGLRRPGHRLDKEVLRRPRPLPRRRLADPVGVFVAAEEVDVDGGWAEMPATTYLCHAPSGGIMCVSIRYFAPARFAIAPRSKALLWRK